MLKSLAHSLYMNAVKFTGAFGGCRSRDVGAGRGATVMALGRTLPDAPLPPKQLSCGASLRRGIFKGLQDVAAVINGASPFMAGCLYFEAFSGSGEVSACTKHKLEIHQIWLRDSCSWLQRLPGRLPFVMKHKVLELEAQLR